MRSIAMPLGTSSNGASNKRKKPRRGSLKKNKDATTNKTIKPATCNRELAFLKLVLNRLLANGDIGKNPAARYKMLKEDSAWTVISRKTEAKYLMECSQPLLDVARIMLETGMRPDEVFPLEKRDLNFEKGIIHIPRGKTPAARRKLRMSALVRDILWRRVSEGRGEYVFAGGKDGQGDDPIEKLNGAHNGAVKRAKLKFFRMYDLRHTFATRAVENGMDLMTLKNILGHEHLAMVLKYAHPSDDHNFEAMRKLEEVQLLKNGSPDTEWPEKIS